jgi:15-cis-phytoene synthase
MQDAFAYCAELVRAADRDHYLATLFAPAEYRDALYALYAFNVEVARIRELAREALPGEIRLRWWSEAVNGERNDEARANPVAAALLGAIERHKLAPTRLADLIEARRFDLYDEPMAHLGDLEAYASKTSSALIALAAQILAGGDVEEIAQPAGMACAIVGVMHTFPRHAARRQLYVPVQLLEQHGVAVEDIFAGRSSAALIATFAELRAIGSRHLTAVHERLATLPGDALSPFLPVALVRPSLDRLRRCDPFSPIELSPWRRQWLIWRAARNPARIGQ